MPRDSLSEFTDAYIECAGWCDQEELKDAEFAPETLESMRADCAAFYIANEALIGPDEYKGGGYSSVAMAGHDFWLTRNGHGAGFWDGDWVEPSAAILTDAAHAFGQRDQYLGDDGFIYHG